MKIKLLSIILVLISLSSCNCEKRLANEKVTLSEYRLDDAIARAATELRLKSINRARRVEAERIEIEKMKQKYNELLNDYETLKKNMENSAQNIKNKNTIQ